MSNIIFIIAPVNFRDEEYFEPKVVLEKAGHTVTTASSIVGPVKGSHGGKALATLSLNDVHHKNFDAVAFIGGQGSYQYDLNKQAHRIANEFYVNKKITAAICHAPIILAQAGLLHEKTATVHIGDAEQLQNLGAIYMTEPVVVDGIIITADGPSSAKIFGKTIASHIL